MRHVIGVVGENGAGKGTFSNLFVQLAKDKKVAVIRFSDILYKTLDLWDLPGTRVNLQDLAIAMNEKFGNGTLTHAARKLVSQQKADVVIIEGVRWMSDVPMIRSFKKNSLIYITADPKVRYRRMKLRREKSGEANKTYTQFLQEEKAKTEIEIKKIGATADTEFTNNGDIKDLREQILKFCKLNFN